MCTRRPRRVASCAAVSPAAPARFRRSSRRSRREASASTRSRPTGLRSTTSTSTTPDESSPPRTRPEDATTIPPQTDDDARRPPHLVHGRPPAPEPDARADLDRALARAADGLAAALRSALQARHAAPGWRLRNHFVHHLPRPRDRDHELVFRRDVERYGDDQRPRP